MDELVLYELDGYSLWAHPDSRVASKLKLGVPYEAKLLNHTVGRYSGHVIDVGASIGNHSLFWWAQGLNVTAVEPNWPTFQHLQRNVKTNHALLTMRLWGVALSDKRTKGSIADSMAFQYDDGGDVDGIVFDSVWEPTVRVERVR